MDQVTPLDLRMWRAMDIPDNEIIVQGVRSLDPETGSTFVGADFVCESQSHPGKFHLGHVAFNGRLETCRCECEDHAEKRAFLDGQPVCKHCLKALMRLGYISAPAVFENSVEST